jgi:hypothetical protein
MQLCAVGQNRPKKARPLSAMQTVVQRIWLLGRHPGADLLLGVVRARKLPIVLIGHDGLGCITCAAVRYLLQGTTDGIRGDIVQGIISIVRQVAGSPTAGQANRSRFTRPLSAGVFGQILDTSWTS